MQKLILITGAISAGLSVAIGAFGAHALKELLESTQRTDTFNTGVTYQFFHSLALMITGLLMFKIHHRFLPLAAWSHLAGIVFFSGSLYLLCLTSNTKWGAVTPIGGLFFILGWVLLTVALVRS